EPLRGVEELGVGHVALLALLSSPVERHAVAAAGVDVAVERLRRRVQLPADEPPVEGGLRLVEHRVPRLGPVEQLLRLPCPPGHRVLGGLLVDRLVLDQRVLTEVRGRLEELLVEKLSELPLDL